MPNHFIQKNFEESQKLMQTILNDESFFKHIKEGISLMVESLKSNGALYSCGNGGSMCDAMHFAEELTGRFRKDRAPLKAVAINDPGYMTCVANDFGYDDVFSRFLDGWANPGDVLLAISTSGNSKNVIKAVKVAQKKNVKVIALLGKDGGELKSMVDVPIIVPSAMTDRIQEIHIKIIHNFIEGIERELFPDHYTH